MKSYSVLNNLPAMAFLVPDDFRTDFDALKCNLDKREEKYQKGLALGLASLYVSIACNSTWGASGKDGSSTHSYEGIGYHANTADFLRGIIDSGVPIVVYRGTESGITETWIQGEKPAGQA
jgi:hypothetical protein